MNAQHSRRVESHELLDFPSMLAVSFCMTYEGILAYTTKHNSPSHHCRPDLSNPSSSTHQLSYHVYQSSLNAVHAPSVPSSVGDHGGHGSFSASPDPRAVCSPYRWPKSANLCHRRYHVDDSGTRWGSCTESGSG